MARVDAVWHNAQGLARMECDVRQKAQAVDNPKEFGESARRQRNHSARRATVNHAHHMGVGAFLQGAETGVGGVLRLGRLVEKRFNQRQARGA